MRKLRRKNSKSKLPIRLTLFNKFSTRMNGVYCTTHSSYFLTMPKEIKLSWWSTWSLGSRKPLIRNLKRYSNLGKTKIKLLMIKTKGLKKYAKNSRKAINPFEEEKIYYKAMTLFYKWNLIKFHLNDISQRRKEKKQKRKG